MASLWCAQSRSCLCVWWLPLSDLRTMKAKTENWTRDYWSCMLYPSVFVFHVSLTLIPWLSLYNLVTRVTESNRTRGTSSYKPNTWYHLIQTVHVVPAHTNRTRGTSSYKPYTRYQLIQTVHVVPAHTNRTRGTSSYKPHTWYQLICWTINLGYLLANFAPGMIWIRHMTFFYLKCEKSHINPAYRFIVFWSRLAPTCQQWWLTRMQRLIFWPQLILSSAP